MSDEIQNVTCPLCETPGFSARGLRTHRCDGANRQTGSPARFAKRPLTSAEYVEGVLAAKKAQAEQLMPGGGPMKLTAHQLEQIAAQYRLANPIPSGGYVVVYGTWIGWASRLKPQNYKPGALAVAESDDILVAVGGNDNDGAESFEIWNGGAQ